MFLLAGAVQNSDVQTIVPRTPRETEGEERQTNAEW